MDATGIDPVTGYWRMRGVYNPTKQQLLSTPRVMTDANGQEWAVAPGTNQHVKTGRRWPPGQVPNAAMVPGQAVIARPNRLQPESSQFGPDVEASNVIPAETPSGDSALSQLWHRLDWKTVAVAALLGYIILKK